ncbi:MAG TPA: YtxH domain-containing protein [Ktedonobacteraceae bacterium]|nr:YtxH domain-containing protein [Ktedonobacteraceae bacterium]
MGSLLNGFPVGLGMGVLVAPRSGEEMRRLVSKRLAGWRIVLPDGEQRSYVLQPISERVSQPASTLNNTGQPTQRR